MSGGAAGPWRTCGRGAPVACRVVSRYFWPFDPYGKCRGSRRNAGPNRKRFGDCKPVRRFRAAAAARRQGGLSVSANGTAARSRRLHISSARHYVMDSLLTWLGTVRKRPPGIAIMPADPRVCGRVGTARAGA
jgi:hypothetical protein